MIAGAVAPNCVKHDTMPFVHRTTDHACVRKQHSLAPSRSSRERLAELATDALRAQLLEIAGYKTQVLEFIQTEHTPKNLLIRAVRHESASSPAAKHVDSYRQLKGMFGMDSVFLESQLPESLRETLRR